MGASFLNLVATKVTIKGEEQKFVSLRLHQSFTKQYLPADSGEIHQFHWRDYHYFVYPSAD